MKKILIFLFALGFMVAAPHGEANGQKFLKKISNAVDKGLDAVDRSLDKALGNAPGKHTYENEDGTKITTWSEDIQFDVESCVRDGEEVTITYKMRNKGDAFKITSLGTGKSEATPKNETVVIDDLENRYEVSYLSLGGIGSTDKKSTLDLNLPGKSILEGTIEVYGVSPEAKSFSKVTIAGLFWDANDKSWPVEFAFEPVTITDIEDVLDGAEELEVIDEPYSKGGKYRPKRIVITNKYTRADIECINMTDSIICIWLQNPEEMHMEACGKKYRLIGSQGIAKRKNKDFVEPGQTRTFTLLYEPATEGCESYTLNDPTGSEIKVYREKPLGVEIERTTGTMTLEDSYDKHDKMPRLTPAQRSELKIDQIKLKDFDTSWKNSELAKGKTVYESELGKLQTILFLNPETYTGEYLVSYDKEGNLIDCVKLGSIHVWGGDRGQGLFEGDKLEVSFEFPEGGTYIEYKITPELKFQKIKEEIKEW